MAEEKESRNQCSSIGESFGTFARIGKEETAFLSASSSSLCALLAYGDCIVSEPIRFVLNTERRAKSTNIYLQRKAYKAQNLSQLSDEEHGQ